MRHKEFFATLNFNSSSDGHSKEDHLLCVRREGCICRRDLRRDRAWCHLRATTEGARDSTWFFETRVVRLVNYVMVNSQMRGGWKVKFVTFSLAAW